MQIAALVGRKSERLCVKIMLPVGRKVRNSEVDVSCDLNTITSNPYMCYICSLSVGCCKHLAIEHFLDVILYVTYIFIKKLKPLELYHAFTTEVNY